MTFSVVEGNAPCRSVGLEHDDRTHWKRRRRDERAKFRTSRFDATVSFLFALLVIVGSGAMILLVMWLTRKTEVVGRLFPPVELVSGGGELLDGLTDFEPPGAIEAEALNESTLEDAIRAVTGAVTNVAASLDQRQWDNVLSLADPSSMSTDTRRPGPSDDDVNIIPRFERWQLEFSAKGLQDYAKQLDHFGFELGMVGAQVDYAFDLSPSPKRRIRLPGAEEKRIYFVFTSPSPLQRYDWQLLTQAGIRIDGRIQVKFISKDLEDLLAIIELEHAKTNGRAGVSEIIKTIFASTQQGESYAFEVVDQRYRR